MSAPPSQQRAPGTPAHEDELEDDKEASAQDEVASASSYPAPSTVDSATLPSSSPDRASDSHISHQQHNLTSISELTSEVTYLHTQHTVQRQRVTLLHEDMATGAMPAFAKANWRQPHQLITGSPNADGWVVVDNKENIAQKTNVQVETGTYSTHQQNNQGFHFDASTESSGHHDSPQQAEAIRSPGHDRYKTDRVEREFASIEAQLKEATEEVAHLRAEAEARMRDESGIPQCYSQASAARLLQLEHEAAQLQRDCLLDVSMHDAPALPQSKHDFPGLRTTESTPERLPATTPRKPSYANMATQGMMNAIGKNFPPMPGSGNQSSTSNGSTYAHTACSCAASHTSTNVTTEAETGDDSVIVSPRSDDQDRSGHVSAPKGSPTAKSSPRFAQPTKAFSRRADETVRRDSAISAGKTGTIVKPTSVRAPTQKQQKRKALPGDWFGQSPEQASPSAQTDGDPPSTEHVDTCQKHQEPVLRKLPSTYMSPTKAAARRTIATIGQETITHPTPRIPRNLAKLNLNTVNTSFESDTQASSPASPETAIETANIAMRKLQVQTRPSESPKVAVPRRLTITSALPHSSRPPTNTSIADLLATQAKAAGLPMPANTTTQRRGSHGHLLIPIKEKLDKIGVLKDNPLPSHVRRDSELLSPISPNSEPELFSPLTRTMVAVQAALPATPRNQFPAAIPVVAPLNDRKVVPPHVRAAMRDAAAAAEAKKTAAAMAPSLRATAMEFTPMRQQAQLPQPPQMTNLAIAQSLPEAEQHGLFQPLPDLPSITSTIQPAMQGLPTLFSPGQPMQGLDSVLNLSSLPRQPSFMTGAESMPVVTDEDAMKFYHEEQWSSLTGWDRKRICDRREILRSQGRLRNNPAFTQTSVTTCSDVFHGKPITLPAGAVLLPKIDPVTKEVSWTLQSANECKAPIGFGRAAPPAIGPQPGADQVQTSPELTSPTPLPRSWTIGSEQARQVFGWKGGDGREIKFVGHGPDAERDPNNGIRFNYQRRVTSIARGPRMIGEEQEEDSQDVPLAPRGRRQWAQLAGSPRQPCDKIDIVGATEQMPIPFGPALHGYCNGCAVSSH